MGNNDIITEEAIAVIRHYCTSSKPYLAFSGGKDSVVLMELVRMAGIEYDAHFSVTTVDPPEVLRFIRDYYPDVIWERPEKTMWQLIIENGMPPTRRIRYCCRLIKESCGDGRTVLTGVRRSESSARKNRQVYERCFQDELDKAYVNPILEWTTGDVWDFIRKHDLQYCSLYDEGFKRIGCVMCPMNRRRVYETERFPGYYKAYLRAFDKMLRVRETKGLKTTWETAEDVMAWWLQDDAKYADRVWVEQSQLKLDLVQKGDASERL